LGHPVRQGQGLRILNASRRAVRGRWLATERNRTAPAGPPLGFGNAIFNGDIKNIPLPKDQRNVSQWFNVNAGFNRRSQSTADQNLRTFPLLFSGGKRRWTGKRDFSLIKNFPIHESVAFQFRADATTRGTIPISAGLTPAQPALRLARSTSTGPNPGISNSR